MNASIILLHICKITDTAKIKSVTQYAAERSTSFGLDVRRKIYERQNGFGGNRLRQRQNRSICLSPATSRENFRHVSVYF